MTIDFDDERHAFEAWAQSNELPLHRRAEHTGPKSGVYLDVKTDYAWGAWAHRAAQEEKPDAGSRNDSAKPKRRRLHEPHKRLGQVKDIVRKLPVEHVRDVRDYRSPEDILIEQEDLDD
jgi:hypothetical protein